MRKRVAEASVIADVLPAELIDLEDPKWWTWTPKQADRDQMRSFIGRNAGVTPEQGLGVMAQWRARQAQNSARREWCEANGMVDAHGQIDWRRFGPLLKPQ